jgi:hypothetical protein
MEKETTQVEDLKRPEPRLTFLERAGMNSVRDSVASFDEEPHRASVLRERIEF